MVKCVVPLHMPDILHWATVTGESITMERSPTLKAIKRGKVCFLPQLSGVGCSGLRWGSTDFGAGSITPSPWSLSKSLKPVSSAEWAHWPRALCCRRLVPGVWLFRQVKRSAHGFHWWETGSQLRLSDSRAQALSPAHYLLPSLLSLLPPFLHLSSPPSSSLSVFLPPLPPSHSLSFFPKLFTGYYVLDSVLSIRENGVQLNVVLALKEFTA